mgnify:FL=1
MSFFLDRNKNKETAKAQLFYFATSIFDAMVLGFLTLFLNECRVSLAWSSFMSSLSLFLPPFFAALGVFICSHFVSNHAQNLKTMRFLLLSLFGTLLLLGFFGIYFPSGVDREGTVQNPSYYYSFFILITSLCSLFMGLYWSFASLHTCSIADINYAEKTRYGHVCLYGSLAPILFAPLAGLIAEGIFQSYRGFLFLFLIASPILLLLFFLTYRFKPFDSSLYHQDQDEKVSYRSLLKNKTYLLYLFLASLWLPLMWASDSLTSSLWTALEGKDGILNSFNPLSWGIYLAFAAFIEFLFVFFNTKVGFGKRVRFSMSLSFIALTLLCVSLGTLSYFYHEPIESDLPLALGIIFLHSFRGASSGLYLTSNILMLHHIIGPKYRRKAVFLAPFLYQIINSILQLVYPYLIEIRYVSFYLFGAIAVVGLLLSFVLDVELLHKPSLSKGKEDRL